MRCRHSLIVFDLLSEHYFHTRRKQDLRQHELEDILETAEMKVFKRIVGSTLRCRESNANVRSVNKMESIISSVKQREMELNSRVD